MVDEKELQEARSMLTEASAIAEELGNFLMEMTDSSKLGTLSAGILFASLAATHGITLHQATGLLMMVYRKHEKYLQENGDDQ